MHRDDFAPQVARLIRILAVTVAELDRARQLAGPSLRARVDSDPTLSALNAGDLHALADALEAGTH